MICSYRAVEAEDPTLHVSTWATPKRNVTSCRNLHSNAIYIQKVLKHIENEGCVWIQVVKVQSAWAWPLLEREMTPKNREKGKQPEREHSTYICSIFKLRSGNPKFIIFTTCFFSYMSEIFHKYKKFLSHTPKKSCLPGRTVPAWPLIHQCRWMSHKKKKTDIGIKDIQIPFLMVARGRAWGQVKEKKKIWLSGKEALAVCYLKTKWHVLSTDAGLKG